mgnify:CR=1 FL=1
MKTAARILIPLLCALLVTGISKAQCVFELKGVVRDADTREPLGYSNIVIVELQRGASSDEDGKFVIKGLCAGTYTVHVSHLSCESREMKIKLDSSQVINFMLPHNANELKEICIAVEKKREQTTQALTEIEGRSLDKTRGESLGESLKAVTGVSALKTGSSVSKPIIHGMHSNRVLILNNGIRQEGQQWGSEHAPEIDPFIASRLTVIKGASAVRYGSDAIAGVILVEPAPLPDTAGISGELNLVGYSNNREGVVSGIVQQNFSKLKPLSWRLQGTLKKGGTVKTPDYYLKNTGYEEKNFSAAAGWNSSQYGIEVFYSQFNTKTGIFSGSHIGNLTDLMAAFNRDEPLETTSFNYRIDRPYQVSEHELFKLKAWLFTGKTGKLSLVAARQYNLRYEYDKHRPLNDELAALNLPELTYEITSQSADLIWEHEQWAGIKGQIGISGMHQGNTFEGRMFIPNYVNNTAGIFVIERWKQNKLELEAGARFDTKALTIYERESTGVRSIPFNYTNVSGTAGAVYEFTEHAKVSLNAGTAWRSPGVNELFSDGLHHGAAAIEKGDSSLVPERSINLVAAVNIHDHRKFAIEVSGYYHLIQNFIYLNPELPPSLTIHGAFPTFYYRQTDATFRGVDLMGKYQVAKGASLHFRADILRAYNEDLHQYLALMPADHYETGVDLALPSQGVFSESYAGVSFDVTAKQGKVSDDADYVKAPDGYTLLNAEAGTTITIKSFKAVISIAAQNILNTRYRNYLNRFRYYADDEGRNISVKLKIPFAIQQHSKTKN